MGDGGEEERQASCQGKDSMPKTVAERVAKRMRQKHSGTIFAPYKCPFCKRWHVGETDKWAKEAPS